MTTPSSFFACLYSSPYLTSTYFWSAGISDGDVMYLSTKLFGKFLNQPLERGASFVDGRPILGPSKTVRGIVLSIMATTAFAPILGFDWIDGFIIASAAMVGDLSSSFLKRHLICRRAAARPQFNFQGCPKVVQIGRALGKAGQWAWMAVVGSHASPTSS
jgi:hypothetical protein